MDRYLVYYYGKEMCSFSNVNDAVDFVRQSRDADFQVVLYERLRPGSSFGCLRIVEV